MSVSGWTNSETFTFIELYKKEACIWNPKHKHHKDKVKVSRKYYNVRNNTQTKIIILSLVNSLIIIIF